MMDVGDWLRRLGLPQYAQPFAENAIDGDILAHLTAEDLKELGVGLLGHRRKLLTAIDDLRSGQNDRPAASGGEFRSADAQTGSSAERRHLTVLFCDLAGSAALSASLDPEDLREVIRNYHAMVAEIVGAQAGFVAQYLAHGALIYFGYPVAHEDDAERAVRSALLLRDAAQHIRVSGFDLQMRAGLATGLVIVGDLSEGSKASHEHRIMGETPNLAARLQALAEPGAIVIDAATRRVTGRLFNLAERSLASLKGFENPVPSWTVLGEAPVESRFEALRSGETPLVGRDEELELLERRWQQIKTGSGRVVLISGEAGLGKSRLVAAFEQRIKDERAFQLRYFCSPQHASTALYPVTAHLTRALNFSPADTAEQKLEKLGALTAKPEHLPFLADLLSLRAGPDARLDNLAPQEKRQNLFAALSARIDQLSRRKPLFILCEDMHWVDPTTQELVDVLISTNHRRPILFVLTYRPQYRPPWSGQANVTSVSLNRLGLEDRAALIRSLSGNAGLSSETIEEIAERTDGIPLFAEELTKALIESGDVGLLRAGPSPADHIPATLHASLMARLDHLGGEARETAQLGSTIGREFTYALLKALAIQSRAVPDHVIDRALTALIDSGLLLARGSPPLSTYTFKHALVHDAAHSTLLRAQRQKLHAVLTEILVADEKTAPELLAYHFSEAGEHEKAAREYLRAARHANEQSAVHEALQNLNQAEQRLGLLPKSGTSETLQLDIEAERILPTVMLAGFGSAEVRTLLDRAESLAEQLGAEKPMLLLFHRYVDHFSRSDLKTALSLAWEFSRQADGELTIIGYRALAGVNMSLGRLREALPHFEKVIAQDPARSAKLRFAYLYDPRTFAYINGALTLLLLGFPDEAERSRERAFALEHDLAHPGTTAWVLAVGLVYAMLTDDRGLIDVLSARLLDHAQKFKMLHFHRLARVNLGYLTALKGDRDAGLTEIEACLSEWRGAGYRYFLSIIWIVQIRVQLLFDNKIDDAFKTAQVALADVVETDEAILAAELHRLTGIIALASKSEPNEALAEQAFKTALDVARSQEAKLLELRAATSLASLWRDQGKRTEAGMLLTPIHDSFTEGFDTPDLRAAKALLNELSTTLHAAQ
jgi:class 3 adenylate cyclase/tetratricopeptide (TPR) repeat protein